MLGKKNKKKHDTGHSPQMLLGSETPFDVTEAYKTLRTNITFTLAAVPEDSPHRNIFTVSSSVPGEGKSLTSANLAISFAQTGSRVLLVDADMRKPVQHRVFGIENETGLSTILLSIDKMAGMIHKDVRPGLDIITSGPIPPNPSGLLGSQVMTTFLTVVSRAYDYVIIDTPPLTIVTDALTFSFNTAGILLAICPEVCVHGDLKRSLEAVGISQTHILGTVMSNTLSGSSSYGYKKSYSHYKYYRRGHYGYAYKSRYGYSYGYDSYKKAAEDSKTSGSSENRK